MQRIAQLALQPAAIHSAIRFQMPDGRLDGLAALEPAALLAGQRLALAAVDDLHPGVVVIHAPEAQIDDDRLGGLGGVLQEDGGLFQLLAEDVPVVRVPGEGLCRDHQAALVGDGNACLDAELIGLPAFPLADALDFRGTQGVELVLVLGLLTPDAFGALQEQVQPGMGGR